MRRVRYALRRDVDELLSSPRCSVAESGIRERADKVLAVDHPLPRPNDRATGRRRSRWSSERHDEATENHGDKQPTHPHRLAPRFGLREPLTWATGRQGSAGRQSAALITG